MTKKLHITSAQINPIVGDLNYNREKILETWAGLSEPTDLIVFPELAVCGYPPEDLVLKPFFLRQVEKTIENILERSRNLESGALIPCPWTIDRAVYNAVHLIENGEIIATRTKHELPNYGVFDEKRVFAAGPLPEPLEFRGVSLGVMICEDMWVPHVAAHLKKQGAEILIVPNASPFDTEKDNARLGYARQRVQETELPLVYVNQVGGQDELVFDGDSFVMNGDGRLILEGTEFHEGTYSVLFERQEGRPWLAGVSERHPDLEGPAEIYEALLIGLRDYITKNGFPGVLLGLSGGIDSALSATIAVDALGPQAVHAVMMPSRYTSAESLEDAAALAKNLGITLDNISIEEPVTTFNELLATHFTSETPASTFENIQPRTRGLILMALSNASGKMVLSTGNKSEMAVGYATLYGDMCGGFNALKDVYKTQVYALSKWRNQNKPLDGFGPGGAVIPERIITRPATAELKENQLDQDTLPPYETLDDILHCLIEKDLDIEAITARGHDHDTVAKVWKMLDLAEYKRRQAPPGIKITPRAFGRDRRYPITNHFVNIVEKSGS